MDRRGAFLHISSINATKRPDLFLQWALASAVAKRRLRPLVRTILIESGYSSRLCRGAVFGKTALVRWWLRKMFRSDQLREILIFSWSFPRQSRSDGTRQSLAPFFQALANALEVQIEDGMHAQDLTDVLLAATKRTPTLLFLDGMEVLVNQRGEFDVGGTQSEEGETRKDTLHYDSLLCLLRGITAATRERTAFLLVTTQIPIGPIVSVPDAKYGEINLSPFPGFDYADPQLERESRVYRGNDGRGLDQSLSDELHRRKDEGEKRTDGVMGGYARETFLDAERSLRLQYMVRGKAEQFGISKERCLLYVASCFEEAADWDAVLSIIRNCEDKGEFTLPWKNLSDDEWRRCLRKPKRRGADTTDRRRLDFVSLKRATLRL